MKKSEEKLEQGYRVLYNAISVKKNHLKIEEILATHPDLDLNHPLDGNLPALHVAVEFGCSVECAQVLIYSGMF
jgi:FKBP-type peptidyl-prolyl cis-trans isomerase 2